MSDPTQVKAGDQVRLRKPHACGSNRWIILRTGADLRLQCAQCRHTVLLSREDFNRAFRGVLGPEP
jgi:hypothetical protein